MKQRLLFPIIALCVFFGAFATTTPTQSQDMATYMLSLINGLRGGLGLHPYTLNASLTLAAQNQASWMAISEQISHTQPDGSTPRTRAQAAGYSSAWVSENIYMGTQATADIAFQWWINSPIHYRGLTNVNYTEIGIAMSEGPTGYKAYVLVFGNPDGTVRVAPPITTSVSDPYGYANANQQGNGTAGTGSGTVIDNSFIPPPFVVGVDNNGYIMHEVQPGDTFAGIVLTYGYDWADVGRVRDINSMSEEDARWLDIGAIILIPPADGTYTPTPGSPEPPTETPTLGPTNTEGPSPTPTITPSATITYTPSPTETPTETMTFTPTPTLPAGVRPLALSVTTPTARVLPTATLTQEPMILPPQTFSSEITPTLTPIVVAQNNPNSDGGLISPVSIAPKTIDPPAQESNNQLVPLLLIAVGLQVVIIGIAGLEFISRRRRKTS
jgi:hypothetical protein